MKSKPVGVFLFSIGAFWMLVPGWLTSWWYVPDYRELGPGFISGSTVYTSGPFANIWALSVPLGSILVLIGLALFVQTEKKRLLFFILGSLLLLLWLRFWQTASITSVLYGIGGGVILICFFLSALSWAKGRPALNHRGRLASDLRITSHLLFLASAWGLCGLLGTPLFGLRPELMAKFHTQSGAYTMGAKVMVCFILGWILLAISQQMDKSSSKTNSPRVLQAILGIGGLLSLVV